MEKAAGKEMLPTTTPPPPPQRRQKLRACGEIFKCRPPHQRSAQHDLRAHGLPQPRLSTGKSHSPPNVADASCIERSHIKVSVSSASLVQENKELSRRKKKIYMYENCATVISARKTKDHYKCQMGAISFSVNTAIWILISHFILTGGMFSVLRDIPMA